MQTIEFTSVLTDIQKQRKSLEFELEMAMQKIIGEWQNKTGLSVESINSSIETIHTLGRNSRSVLTGVEVKLNYEV